MRRPPRNLTVAIALLLLLPGAARAEEVLLGKVGRASILEISPEWRKEFDTYAPARADLDTLAGLSRKAHLDVYFGSWCGDSRRQVPRFLKILDQAAPRRMRVRFYALDRSKKEPARLIEGMGIERVPTFILSVGGREVGRVVETPRTTLEHDLSLLIDRIPAAIP